MLKLILIVIRTLFLLFLFVYVFIGINQLFIFKSTSFVTFALRKAEVSAKTCCGFPTVQTFWVLLEIEDYNYNLCFGKNNFFEKLAWFVFEPTETGKWQGHQSVDFLK